MIFCCTKKVIDKVKKFKIIESTREENGLYNWYVDLVNIERKNYFLFTNSETLFSFFIYAGTKKELENIEVLFEEKLKEEILRQVGTLKQYQEKAIPFNNYYRFTKTNSRSVLGSMNDLKYQIKVQVWHKGPLNRTYDMINPLLNEIPMGAINYEYPKNKMKEALIDKT